MIQKKAGKAESAEVLERALELACEELAFTDCPYNAVEMMALPPLCRKERCTKDERGVTACWRWHFVERARGKK